MNYSVDEISQIVKKVISQINHEQPSEEFLKDIGEPLPSNNTKEVGIALAPAFLLHLHKTLNGTSHKDILISIMDGIKSEGMIPRIIRVTRSSDVAFVASDVAKIVGSGVAIGIQSKGTCVIHQKDLFPLTNLELFPQAPILNLETYKQIGVNAAKYAKGENVLPVKVVNNLSSRPKYQVKAAFMHNRESEYVVKRGPYFELELL